MIGETIVDEIAGAESGCEQRAGEPPIIALPTLGIIDRPRRHEDACEFAGLDCREPAEGRRPLLPLDELGFAQHWQLREVRPRADALGPDLPQRGRQRWSL